MIKEISPKSDPSGEIHISVEQAHGFLHAKWDDQVDATCEQCGTTVKVLKDWEHRDRPKHFYCSHPCYYSSLGREKPMCSKDL